MGHKNSLAAYTALLSAVGIITVLSIAAVLISRLNSQHQPSQKSSQQQPPRSPSLGQPNSYWAISIEPYSKKYHHRSIGLIFHYPLDWEEKEVSGGKDFATVRIKPPQEKSEPDAFDTYITIKVEPPGFNGGIETYNFVEDRTEHPTIYRTPWRIMYMKGTNADNPDKNIDYSTRRLIFAHPLSGEPRPSLEAWYEDNESELIEYTVNEIIVSMTLPQ